MVVKIRGITGTILEMDSVCEASRDATGFYSCVVVMYQVKLLELPDKEVTFKSIYPNEIEYIGLASTQ